MYQVALVKCLRRERGLLFHYMHKGWRPYFTSEQKPFLWGKVKCNAYKHVILIFIIMTRFLKTSIAAIVALIGFTANAQEPLGITVKAGLNVNYATIKGSDYNDLSPRVGFHIGAAYEIPVAGSFAIEPAVLLDTRGFQMDNTALNTGKAKASFVGITIPVAAKYSFLIGNDNKLFVAAGPFANIALSGKLKEGGKKEDVKFGSGGDETKRANYGITAGAGVELNRFVISLMTDSGISKINNDSDTKLRLGDVKLSVGYKF